MAQWSFLPKSAVVGRDWFRELFDAQKIVGMRSLSTSNVAGDRWPRMVCTQLEDVDVEGEKGEDETNKVSISTARS
jgi:hypothetical protein